MRPTHTTEINKEELSASKVSQLSALGTNPSLDTTIHNTVGVHAPATRFCRVVSQPYTPKGLVDEKRNADQCSST